MTRDEALAYITPNKLSPSGASITFNVGRLRDAVAVIREALAADIDHAAPRAGTEAMRVALGEFRDHVIKNAVVWKDGDGSLHHPIWDKVADALEDTKPAVPRAGNEAMRAALEAALAEHDETHGQSTNDAHWSSKARAAMKDTAP